MTTTPIAYAGTFDSDNSMAWGWLWANIDGRNRWHLVHTYEDAESGHVRVRFIGIEGPGDDFDDDAQDYDGAPFVWHMPPGHTASWLGQENADRRLQVWWGDGSSSCYEWRSGPAGQDVAAKAAGAVELLMKKGNDE